MPVIQRENQLKIFELKSFLIARALRLLMEKLAYNLQVTKRELIAVHHSLDSQFFSGKFYERTISDPVRQFNLKRENLVLLLIGRIFYLSGAHGYS